MTAEVNRTSVIFEVKLLLQEQLAWARRAHRSVFESFNKITDRLEDLGMDMGFVPVEPLVIGPGFREARVVLAFRDHTEAEVAV